MDIYNKNVALCTEVPNFQEVYNTSKVKSKNLKRLPEIVEFRDVIELSIWPDADTNMLYMYTSVLKNTEEKVIGYRVYHAYHNTEMESMIKLESRFNLAGKLVSITIDN